MLAGRLLPSLTRLVAERRDDLVLPLCLLIAAAGMGGGTTLAFSPPSPVTEDVLVAVEGLLTAYVTEPSELGGGAGVLTIESSVRVPFSQECVSISPMAPPLVLDGVVMLRVYGQGEKIKL